MNILGIESSCDETAAAVVSYKNKKFKEVTSVVHTQIPIHQKTQGVVPEVAARSHVEHIIPVLESALKKVGRGSSRVNLATQIDAIAVTGGPGLMTSLLVGMETAKTLGTVFNKPIIRVNHLHAHLLVAHILNKPIKYPALGLLVSGGHTELVWFESKTRLKTIGATRDDAAGEALDKAAKMLGLGYPGGPIISKRALNGDPEAFNFPRPMLNDPGFDFSFSGLKTAVLYTLDKMNKPERARYTSDICASFLRAVDETLVGKTVRAAQKLQPKTVFLAGGVAGNPSLRNMLKKELQAAGFPPPLIPPREYCTDNAIMIATAGALLYKARTKKFHTLEADPNWELPRRLKNFA